MTDSFHKRFVVLFPIVLAASLSPASADPKPNLVVMLPMSDGVKLATDVYLPEGQGPWPTRLVRTPYGRKRYNNEYVAQARRGYAMVLQDMRGRWDSGGKGYAFLGCGWGAHRDGVETLKWIREQPWCNGKIGTEGASAMGITQYMLSGAHPTEVAAQYILVAAPSLYHHASYPGGALAAGLAVSWLTDNAFHPDNIWMLAMHPLYDEHWSRFDSIQRVSGMTIPAVHYGGWYDVFQQGTIDGFVARHNSGGEGARGTQKLIIGPWAHGGPNGRPVGTVKFPPNSQKLSHPCGGGEWFDHYLKGVDNGVEKTPAVQYYTMGAIGPDEKGPGNVWKSAENWPVPSTATPYYFHPSGALSAQAPDGADDKREFDYSPLRPVPTRGGCLLGLPSGPYDQRELDERPDVLAFTTPPLESPVEVTGRLIANLWIISDRVDTDFTVKLTDVYPSGASMLIADGILRCRYRKGFDRLAMLEPGEPTEIEVDLWSTSYVFHKDHRIRVSVSSSNYPKYDVNPNTGWPAWPMTPILPAHNQVLCARDRASHIVLPIISDNR